MECGGGVETRYRSCSRPAPQGGGADCESLVVGGQVIRGQQDFPCNEQPCPLPVEFQWSEWSECSARCGLGEQRRYKMCGSVRRRLPGMIGCHQKLGQTTTEQPATIPPAPGATAPPAAAPAPAPGPAPTSTACSVAPYPANPDNSLVPADNNQVL